MAQAGARHPGKGRRRGSVRRSCVQDIRGRVAQGEYRNCGKWGHQAKTANQATQPQEGDTSSASSASGPSESAQCTSTVRALTVIGEEEELCSDGEGDLWCMGLSADDMTVAGSSERILIDSGSDEHVCPEEFATGNETYPVPRGMMRDAQGWPIPRKRGSGRSDWAW